MLHLCGLSKLAAVCWLAAEDPIKGQGIYAFTSVPLAEKLKEYYNSLKISRIDRISLDLPSLMKNQTQALGCNGSRLCLKG